MRLYNQAKRLQKFSQGRQQSGHTIAASDPQPIPGIPDSLDEFCAMCRIVSGLKTIQYEPYGYQRSLYNILEMSSSAWLKTRQLGLTQAALTLLLFEAARFGYTALWISRAGEDGKEVIKRCRKIVYGVPGLRDYLASDNQLSMEFWDGSKSHPWGRIVTRAPVSDCGRGLSNVKTIVFDEAQSIDDLETVYGAALPTSEAVGDASRVLLLGTPPESPVGFYWDLLAGNNPEGFDLRQMCDRVADREIEPYQQWTDSQGWTKVVCHWAANPKHSHKSVDEYLDEVRTRTQLPESQLQREYGLKIPSVDESAVFPFELVEKAVVEPCDPSEKPSKSARCYIGVDPSGISGRDYTAAVVLEKQGEKYRVVQIFRKRSGTSTEHLSKIASLARKWKPEEIKIESNGVGSTWSENLALLNLPSRIESAPTTATSKPAMISRLTLLLERNHLEIPPGILQEEMLSFRQVGKRMEAASGGTDDVIMAMAIAISAAATDEKPDWMRIRPTPKNIEFELA